MPLSHLATLLTSVLRSVVPPVVPPVVKSMYPAPVASTLLPSAAVDDAGTDAKGGDGGSEIAVVPLLLRPVVPPVVPPSSLHGATLLGRSASAPGTPGSGRLRSSRLQSMYPAPVASTPLPPAAVDDAGTDAKGGDGGSEIAKSSATRDGEVEVTPHEVGSLCIFKRGASNPRRVHIESVTKGLIYKCAYSTSGASSAKPRRIHNVLHKELELVSSPEDLAREEEEHKRLMQAAQVKAGAREEAATQRKAAADRAMADAEARRKAAEREASDAEGKLKTKQAQADAKAAKVKEAKERAETLARQLEVSQQEESAEREKQKELAGQIRAQAAATKTAKAAVSAAQAILTEGGGALAALQQAGIGHKHKAGEVDGEEGGAEVDGKGEKGERKGKRLVPYKGESGSGSGCDSEDSDSDSDSSDRERLDLLRRKRAREEEELEDRLQAKRKRKRRKKEKHTKKKRHKRKEG